MDLIFSTDEFEPGDRFAYWMDFVCKKIMKIDSRIEKKHEFQATVHAKEIAETVVSHFDVTDCEVMRRKAEVAASDIDDLFVGLQLGGSIEATAGDREDVLKPGEIWILDPSRPFTHRCTNCRHVSWRLPRSLVERRLGRAARLPMRKLRAEDPATQLLAAMLKSLPARATAMDDIGASDITDQALDLLTLAVIGDEHHSATFRAYARQAARFRLSATIETHLFDARLKPAEIAEKAGISPRYANKILAAEDTSLERRIFERRLARTRAVLDNSLFDFRPLSEIAHSHGFTSLSHFSRRFKEEYGITPSDYRRQRQRRRTTQARVSEAKKRA
ncbi:MAG: helix-turn-helix domain-containing protein [Methyloceanibacter sp.]|nr:helix-turn-helix domain-containing protein [Methyloceanibacter sp.]